MLARERLQCRACARPRTHAPPHPAVCPTCGWNDPWVPSEKPLFGLTSRSPGANSKETKSALEVDGAEDAPQVDGLEIVDLATIEAEEPERVKTGYPMADLVLGGGLARRRIVLLQASRGTGKSRWLTRVCARVGGLYIDVEEDAADAKLRWKSDAPDLPAPPFATTRHRGAKAIDYVCDAMARRLWSVVVVNSLQSLAGENVQAQGSAVVRLKDQVRTTNTALVLVSQMNASGEARGTKEIEQYVDTIADMRRDPPGADFVLFSCAAKNRGARATLTAWYKHEDWGLVELRGAPSDG